MLKSPTARLVAHVIIAFCAAFFPLLIADQPLSWSVIAGAIVAGARAALGLLTTTNPSVGKNLV